MVLHCQTKKTDKCVLPKDLSRCQCVNNGSRIECLNLSFTQEQSVKAFLALPVTVKEFLFQGNTFKSLPPNIFGACTAKRKMQLEYLSLRDNKIQSISGKTFHCAKNLMRLDLSNNRIGSLSSHFGVFNTLSKLTQLNLERSLATHVHSKLRTSWIHNVISNATLTDVTTLKLGYNNLTALPTAFLLCHLPKLVTLDLRGNKLRKLNIGEIKPYCYKHLKLLDLRSNSFERFADSALRFFHNVSITIYIMNNNFSCDCDMYNTWEWIRHDLTHTKLNQTLYRRGAREDSIFCSSSSQFSDHLVINMNARKLNATCTSLAATPAPGHHGNRASGALIVVGILTAVVIITVSAVLYFNRERIRTILAARRAGEPIGTSVSNRQIGYATVEDM